MQIRIKISKFNPRKIQNFFMSQNLLYEIKYMFFNQMYHKPFLPKVPFWPPHPPPQNTRKPKGYMFSGGITRKRWEEMDYKELTEDLKGQALSQPGNTYLKLTPETLEKGVKYVQG